MAEYFRATPDNQLALTERSRETLKVLLAFFDEDTRRLVLAEYVTAIVLAHHGYASGVAYLITQDTFYLEPYVHKFYFVDVVIRVCNLNSPKFNNDIIYRMQCSLDFVSKYYHTYVRYGMIIEDKPNDGIFYWNVSKFAREIQCVEILLNSGEIKHPWVREQAQEYLEFLRLAR